MENAVVLIAKWMTQTVDFATLCTLNFDVFIPFKAHKLSIAPNSKMVNEAAKL